MLPAVATKVPAAHTVHGVQLLAPSAALNVALGQAAQVRSAVALPGLASNSPGLQTFHGVQVPPLSKVEPVQPALPPPAPPSEGRDWPLSQVQPASSSAAVRAAASGRNSDSFTTKRKEVMGKLAQRDSGWE